MRKIDKKLSISKIDRKIAAIEKDLHETQLDYFYVSSPGYLSKKIKQLDFIEFTTISLISLDFLIYKDLSLCNSSRNTT